MTDELPNLSWIQQLHRRWATGWTGFKWFQHDSSADPTVRPRLGSSLPKEQMQIRTRMVMQVTEKKHKSRIFGASWLLWRRLSTQLDSLQTS